MPDVVFRGCSLGAFLTDFYRNMADAEATFLLPAISLEAAELWEVTESTSFIGRRAMSRARLLELFRGLLVQVGVPVDAAQTATYNRMRRCMPTMANCMLMSKDELQAIGNWTELPEGGHGDPSLKKSKANTPMGLHYAGGKLERSATTKRKCVARFLQMMQKKLTSSSLSVGLGRICLLAPGDGGVGDRAAQADDGGSRDAGKPRPDRGVRGGGAACC